VLKILGHPSSLCDGLSRRELLTAGALSLFGARLAQAAGPDRKLAAGRARSVVLVDLFGGPSHIDTFDLKPDAPAEIRGEFRPLATSLAGLRICEHLPRLARLMHRACLIRTLSHGYNSHNPLAVMTGYTGGNDREDYFAKPTNHPSMGSVCQYAGVGRQQGLPGYVCLPAYPGYSQGLRRAGPYGGYLGSQYDPLFSTCDPQWTRAVDANNDFYDHTLAPAVGDPRLPTLQPELTLDALDRRRTLLEQLESRAAGLDTAGPRVMGRRRREAFDLLLSAAARRAFDLGQEPPAVRDRYGRDLFGSSVLLARRLVEAGVTFITVHTEHKANGHWDTHDNNFKLLQHVLLPFLDRAVSALFEDLDARGLLETTLVVVMGDMGRTPRVNARAGRDHWPQCGFCLLAGGGTKPGIVLGASDKTAAYPKDRPVSPGDLVATIYQLLGIDPEMHVPDQTGRPLSITHGGRPIWEIMI
jgi:hypothetical protein